MCLWKIECAISDTRLKGDLTIMADAKLKLVRLLRGREQYYDGVCYACSWLPLDIKVIRVRPLSSA